MADLTDRRSFVGAVVAGMFVPTFRAHAQQSALPVIGYLGSESPTSFASRLRAFRQGLAETGYVEGRNVALEFRWAQGQHSRLPALAAAITQTRDFSAAGGLMSYGGNFSESHRLAGVYVARLIKGARPADLELQDPRHHAAQESAGECRPGDRVTPPTRLPSALEVRRS